MSNYRYHVIAEARINAGHTQKQAAEVVRVTPRQWQRYESGDSRIPYAVWELYKIKTNQADRLYILNSPLEEY